MLYLKSNSDIAAIISGPDYASIDTPTKNQIALHFEEMPASVREATLDVLLGALPTDQANFAQALFTDAPPAGGSATPVVPPAATSGVDDFVPDIPTLRAVVTAGVAAGSLTRGAGYTPTGTNDTVEGIWTTRAGADADNPPDIVRPNDFDATSNAQVWVKRL